MSFKQIIPFIAAFFLLIACGGKNNRPIKESVSAFMHENSNVVAFGSIDYDAILNKAEYKKIPKFGKILESEFARLGNSLNTESPVYVVMEGPFDSNGNPMTTYAFVDVKNQDSLVERIGAAGMFVEEDGDMKFTSNEDVAIGTKGNLAVVVIQEKEYDAKAVLSDVFKKVRGDVSEGKTNELLNTKGDFVINAHLENLYGTSNTSLENLDASKKESIKKMTQGSFVQTTMNFEKGQLAIRTKNFFAPELKKRMFLKKDPSAKVISNLGTGKVRVGIAANVDVLKVERLMDDFAPELKRNFLSGSSEVALAAMMLGDNPLTNLLSGVAGLAVVGDPNVMMGFIPDVSFNVGIGKKGRPLFELWASEKGGDRFKYTITDTDLKGGSPNAGAGSTSLTIPACGKDFGKFGITGFVDLEGLEIESFGLPRAYKAANIVKNITFKMDNDGGEFIIRSTNPSQNILKQVIDLYVKDIEKTISNLVI